MSIYPTVRPSLTLDFQKSKQLDPRISFSRSSSATYVEGGVIKYADEHQARFEEEGLLIEESRTNYFTNSVYSYLSKQGTNLVIDQNTTDIAAPDGTFTATHITADLINYWNSQFFTPVSTDVGKQFTYSYWVYLISCTPRSGSGTDTDNTIRLGIDTNRVLTYQNRTVEKNKWVRIQITTTNTYVSGNNVQCSMFRDNEYVDVYVWGFQCENGSFATSLIPSSGSTSTVTRSADIALITSDNFSSWYNQNEGTISFSFYSRPTTAISQLPKGDFLFSIYGTNGNRIQVITRRDSPTGAAISRSFIQASNNTQFAAQTNEPIVYGEKYETALSYEIGGGGFATQGVLNTSANTPSVLPAVTTLEFGYISQSVVNHKEMLNGHISRFTFYPRRLTDLELQTLTS